MAMSKKYWKGIDELQETKAFIESRDNEFPQSVSVDEFLGDEQLAETSTARRDFLKFLGFSVAAATVAACEAPVTKAIPYVIKPENVTPGMPTWYASTYYDGNSYASILVKTREGRPIYIKGNRDHGFTMGATNPQIIASVLGLYDQARLSSAQIAGKNASWSTLDKEVVSKLKAIGKKGGKVAIVSPTIISMGIQTALVELSNSIYGETPQNEMAGPAFNPNFNVINYDAVSYAGMREANLASFGMRAIPDYDFTAAKTIVSVGADFMGTWLLGNQFAAQYSTRRNPDGEWMSKHYHFESTMSVSGSNADERGPIKPSEQAAVLAFLLKGFGVNTGVSTDLNAEAKAVAEDALKALKASKGASIIVSGSNNVAIQVLTNKLNEVLGSYGKTLKFENQIMLFQSEDAKMAAFVKDAIAGKVDGVIFLGANPVYSLPNGKEFAAALSKMDVSVAISTHADETASKCSHIAAAHHDLEAWNDFNPKAGHYGIAQPTIRPLHNTADAIESLMVWAGKADRGGKDSKVAYNLIQNNWMKYGYPSEASKMDFNTYWGLKVHDTVDTMPMPAVPVTFNAAALSGVAGKLPKFSGTEVVFYQKMGIGNGALAANPWLQELPDPITKVTWDNYITMNPGEMEKNGYATTYDQENGLNTADVTVNGQKFTLPVYPSPGQVAGTIGIALGYGRGEANEEIGNAAYQTLQYGGFDLDEKGNRKAIGQNAYRMVGMSNGTYSYEGSATVAKAAGIHLIAATQIHHTVMGRNSIIKETSLEIYKNEEPGVYNHKHVLHTHEGEKPISEFDLWDAHPVEHIGHRWGMSIDLSNCIGCGSCLIACQAENNVPVVGKDEIRRGREMHWLRVDRYFASDVEAAPGSRKDHGMSKMEYFAAAEIASNNPKVVHMPLMCHHCNHAPCETVCPVAATTHSNEGLNQMAYNRCIGTRYCANNCPYKVRRFNWFNYPSYKKFTEVNPAQDDLGRMVLNPDVTVRTRGVMEKCSFCVQRIQAGKLVAKNEGRPVQDGDVVTACQDACPTNAITVGDWNDVNSSIRKVTGEKRAYQALEEVGVKPNVWYQVKVRNEKNAELNKLVAAHHAEGHGHAEHKKEKKNH